MNNSKYVYIKYSKTDIKTFTKIFKTVKIMANNDMYTCDIIITIFNRR